MPHAQVKPRAKSEPSIIQAFIDFAVTWFEQRNYTLTVDTDMAAWVDVLSNAPSISVITPSHDPRCNALPPSANFWLDIRAGSQTIATSAARLFVTDDILTLMRSRKLWRDRPASDAGELAITPPPDLPNIAGRVGLEGGLWIHPDHRKRGLSVMLPHLNRALCRRQWQVDWQIGITLRSLGESGMAYWAYGFPHGTRFFEGISPITEAYDHLYLVYMDAAELVGGLDLDAVARLLPNSHQKSVNAMASVHKR
jgi:hypothetical protein